MLLDGHCGVDFRLLSSILHILLSVTVCSEHTNDLKFLSNARLADGIICCTGMHKWNKLLLVLIELQ